MAGQERVNPLLARVLWIIPASYLRLLQNGMKPQQAWGDGGASPAQPVQHHPAMPILIPNLLLTGKGNAAGVRRFRVKIARRWELSSTLSHMFRPTTEQRCVAARVCCSKWDFVPRVSSTGRSRRFADSGNPKIILQGSKASTPDSLQSQKPSYVKIRLLLNSLRVVHGRPPSRLAGTRALAARHGRPMSDHRRQPALSVDQGVERKVPEKCGRRRLFAGPVSCLVPLFNSMVALSLNALRNALFPQHDGNLPQAGAVMAPRYPCSSVRRSKRCRFMPH
jgi:hypothetical protein